MDLNQLEAFLTAQTKKQGGITSDQAAVIAKFWKNHRIKIHESLINQSRWDNVLKNMNWRVDLKSQSRHVDQINTPVAIVEMELGKNGQSYTGFFSLSELCSTAEGCELSWVQAAHGHMEVWRLFWGRFRNRSFSVWSSMRPK
ncbi:COMM domain-containing protein 1 isoform X2 [Tyto alba]|uniref:COMM domain-containing protein 1 isoform X2 n=1 Tax=Tyto alba TaxID=56313 RepID=UPI001C6641FD|nr:COMM domain-containing protein 1 isoform X2 [Tyto alba]